jgi:hypothetical protein
MRDFKRVMSLSFFVALILSMRLFGYEMRMKNHRMLAVLLSGRAGRDRPIRRNLKNSFVS